MPPRPLHRWKTFWLGILVLAFLGWASVRSTGLLEIGIWKPRDRAVLIELTGGRVELLTGPMPDMDQRFDYFRWETPAWKNAGLSQSAVKWSTEGEEASIILAHWFLILLFLVPWAGFLGWRVRRVKRLAPGGAEPPARSST